MELLLFLIQFYIGVGMLLALFFLILSVNFTAACVLGFTWPLLLRKRFRDELRKLL